MKLKLLLLTVMLPLVMGCQFELFTREVSVIPRYKDLESGLNAAITNYSLGAQITGADKNSSVYVPMVGLTGDPAAEIAKMILGVEGIGDIGMTLMGETGTTEVLSSSLMRVPNETYEKKTWFSLRFGEK